VLKPSVEGATLLCDNGVISRFFKELKKETILQKQTNKYFDINIKY